MKIAIIGGTGAEGSGLALRWARTGAEIVIGSRDRARAAQRADTIRQRIAGGIGISGSAINIAGNENTAACDSADFVVLTIPFEGHAAVLEQLKPVLKPGQILVDTTVPLTRVPGHGLRHPEVPQGSAAQQAAEILPNVKVVAAFQNVPAELLNRDALVDCDVIVCGDDPEACGKVRELARKIPGLRALDGGKLENAGMIEHLTALLIGINIRYKGHSGIRITGLPESAYQG